MDVNDPDHCQHCGLLICSWSPCCETWENEQPDEGGPVSYEPATPEAEQLAGLIAPVMGAWTLGSPLHDRAPRQVAEAVIRAGWSAPAAVGEILRLRAELEECRRTRALGGPPPPVDKNWANADVGRPASADDPNAPAHRRDRSGGGDAGWLRATVTE